MEWETDQGPVPQVVDDFTAAAWSTTIQEFPSSVHEAWNSGSCTKYTLRLSSGLFEFFVQMCGGFQAIHQYPRWCLTGAKWALILEFLLPVFKFLFKKPTMLFAFFFYLTNVAFPDEVFHNVLTLVLLAYRWNFLTGCCLQPVVEGNTVSLSVFWCRRGWYTSVSGTPFPITFTVPRQTGWLIK